MQRIVCQLTGLLLLGLSSPASSQGSNNSPVIVDDGRSQPLVVQLDAVPKGALVTLLMRDVMRVPYLISSDVLQDRSPLSVNLSIPKNAVPDTVVGFLRSIGLSVALDGGTVFVSNPGGSSPRFAQSLPGQIPSGLPGQVSGLGQGAPPVPAFRPVSIAIFKPVHRPPVELAETLRISFPSLVFGSRDAPAPEGDTIAPAAAADRLTFSGAPDLIEAALKVADALDAPRPLVELQIAVMEVRLERRHGSALQVLSDALQSSVAPSSYARLPIGPQSLSITLGGVTAVLSAVREDGRFTILARPRILVESGSPASLNSGSQVPTLGAVTLTENGQSFRSVEYRPSGLIFEVTPQVIGDRISLQLRQERSSFSPTTTGVEDSPTLDQTLIQTVFTMAPGETVALAGVVEGSNGELRRGLFGGLLGANSVTDTQKEIVIVIEAKLQEIEQAEPNKPVVIGPFDMPVTESGLNPVGGTS